LPARKVSNNSQAQQRWRARGSRSSRTYTLPGRYERNVDIDTVEIDDPYLPPGADEEEYQVSRTFSYLVKSVRMMRLLSDAHTPIRNEKNWGSNPRFTRLTPIVPKWFDELPPDMQVHYPPDGSPPWLSSHVVGNFHCHHHLAMLVLHRPQLMASSSFTPGGSWRQHMEICYSSAKSLCRLQEALLQNFGINGLLYTQRGKPPIFKKEKKNKIK
jgi:hypothetical protein